jgi:hypothetical protein
MTAFSFNSSNLYRRQAEPAAVDLGVVLADLGARARFDRPGAVQAQRPRAHDDFIRF